MGAGKMRETGKKPVQYTMLQQKRWHTVSDKFSIVMYKPHFHFEKDRAIEITVKWEKHFFLVKMLTQIEI